MHENWNIQPDIMAMAKGITGAYLPFGAVTINDEIYKGLKGKMFMQVLPIVDLALLQALP